MASAWDSTVVTGGGTPSGSAWDQTPARPLQQAPVEDPGILNSFLIGAGRTFDRIGKGAQQVYYGLSGDKAAQANLAANAAENDAIYGRLQNLRPFSTGLGEAAPSMALAGSGGVTLGTTLARQVSASALPELASYGSAKDRLQNAGWAATGAAVAPVLAAGGRTAYAAAEPFFKGGQDKIIGRTLNRVAGQDADQVLSKLQNAAPVVPGSMPTAGQVAENGGIAALERSASAVDPEAYTTRALQQAAARKAAVESVAGTESQLQDAINMRGQVGNSTYGYANQVGPDPLAFTPQAQANIAAMQSRVPQSALDHAKLLAQINGTPMDNSSVINGMHWTKEGISDLANTASQSGSNSLAGAYKNLAGNFTQGLRQISPLYGAASDIYSDMSRPINQMQVGQALRDKMLPALSDHGALAQETAANYARALADDGLPARVTGFPGATWANTMEPGQMNTLNSVAQDLARKANAQNLGRNVGSDTVQKLAMQNIAAESGMPSAMSLVTKVGGAPLSWAYQGANQEMSQKLAQALLNPQSAASLMSGAKPTFMADNPIAKKLLIQSLLRSSMLGKPAGMAADQVLTPALTAE